MAKRLSTEARLLDWIDQAPIEVVTAIMSIATARHKARLRKEQPQQLKAPRKLKQSGNNATTVFPAGEVRTA